MQLVYALTKPGSLVFIKHPKTFLNLCSLCFSQKTHLGKSKNETKALCQACFSQTCQQLSLANELKLPKSRVAHAYLFPNTPGHTAGTRSRMRAPGERLSMDPFHLFNVMTGFHIVNLAKLFIFSLSEKVHL